MVADALSRVHEGQKLMVQVVCCPLISRPHYDLLKDIRNETSVDVELVQLCQRIILKELSPDYSIKDDLILFRNRLVIGSNPFLKSILLKEYHTIPIAGHVGVKQTLARIATTFDRPN